MMINLNFAYDLHLFLFSTFNHGGTKIITLRQNDLSLSSILLSSLATPSYQKETNQKDTNDEE